MMTSDNARERYEMALERLKQAALQLRQARRRGDKDLAACQADVDKEKRAFEAIAKEPDA